MNAVSAVSASGHTHASLPHPPAPAREHDQGEVYAVRDVSFAADDGRITGLLGPNGAGKTTTLRMLAGLLLPDAGRIRVDGIDVVAAPRRALARLGVLSDARGLYPRLSARENIVYYAALHGLRRDAAHARAEQLAQTLDMVALLERRTEGFSQGERMKTALARALVHDPANIVLDEPTNGLDVVATRALREILRWLRSPEGGAKCIVVSTHIMQEVERLCDQVHVVAEGRTVASGSVAELLARTAQHDFEEAFVQLAYGRAATPPSLVTATARKAEPAVDGCRPAAPLAGDAPSREAAAPPGLDVVVDVPSVSSGVDPTRRAPAPSAFDGSSDANAAPSPVDARSGGTPAPSSVDSPSAAVTAPSPMASSSVAVLAPSPVAAASRPDAVPSPADADVSQAVAPSPGGTPHA